MSATITIEAPERFTTALAQFLALSRRSFQDAVSEVARNFVRRVIAITPPAQGKADVAAKKAGETAVEHDIRRIIRPAPAGYISALRRAWGGDTWKPGPIVSPKGDIYSLILHGGGLAAYHDAAKSKITGRVGYKNVTALDAALGSARTRGRRGRAESALQQAARTGIDDSTRASLRMAVTDSGSFRTYLTAQKRQVGWLAAGWNAAAAKLGTPVPQWIKRHGEGAGAIDVRITDDAFRIVITNAVKYAGHVKGLESRVAAALNQQAEAMEKRVASALASSASRSGMS